MKTELPGLVALTALDKVWLTPEHLSEIQALGLVWNLLSGQALGLELMETAGAILARGEPAGVLQPTSGEVEWLRGTLPGVVAAIAKAPNTAVDHALQRAQRLTAANR